MSHYQVDIKQTLFYNFKNSKHIEGEENIKKEIIFNDYGNNATLIATNEHTGNFGVSISILDKKNLLELSIHLKESELKDLSKMLQYIIERHEEYKKEEED
jgi:uncharacterized protein (DUF342 family)